MDININRALKTIFLAAKRGGIKAGKDIRRDGMIITPVKTGNLVESWFGPDIEEGASAMGDPITITFGNNANYAIPVHESVGKVFRKPKAKAKFLEEPMLAHEQRVMETVQKEVKKALMRATALRAKRAGGK